MSAIKTHIAIAASEGMKAGHKAYTRKLRASGLPEVRAAADQFKGRRGFALYCTRFGADVDAAKGQLTRPTRTYTRSSRTLVSVPVLSEREQLLARLAELDAQEAAVVEVRPSRSSKPTTVKENLWRPWAIRKYGIPTTVGNTWVYTRKNGGKSTHKVVRITADGVFTVKVG